MSKGIDLEKEHNARTAYLIAKELNLSKRECSIVSQYTEHKNIPEQNRDILDRIKAKEIVALAKLYEELSKKYPDKPMERNLELNNRAKEQNISTELIKTMIEDVAQTRDREIEQEQPIHWIIEQQMEDFYGMDIGHLGYISDDRDRPKSLEETDRLEKHYGMDFDGVGRADVNFEPSVKDFDERILAAKEMYTRTAKAMPEHNMEIDLEEDELELTRVY